MNRPPQEVACIFSKCQEDDGAESDQASASAKSSSALSWLLTQTACDSRAPEGVGGRSASRLASSAAASWHTAGATKHLLLKTYAVKLRPLPTSAQSNSVLTLSRCVDTNGLFRSLRVHSPVMSCPCHPR